MVHGEPVTLADMNGWGDPTHWRGKWRKGFGKDVCDPSVIVGNWTHFVVTSNSDAGTGQTLRAALTSSTPYWITFDPSMGASTITLGSSIGYRENKFIDGSHVRITLDGIRQLIPSSSFQLATSANPDRGRFGAYNIIFRNGGGFSSGDDQSLTTRNGSTPTTGRMYFFLAFCQFNNPDNTLDDFVDSSGMPSLGWYQTQVGCWFGGDTGVTGDYARCQAMGNNRDDQFNHHNRLTFLRNAFYCVEGSSRINFRTPLITDAHFESMETYRELGTRQVIARNNTTANLRRMIMRTRHDIWDIAKSSASGPHIANDGGSSTAAAYVRKEDTHECNGSTNLASGTLTIPEIDRSVPSDSTIYVDESGTSISQYNDYTPGTDFAGLTNAQCRTLIRNFSKWTDRVTLGGTAKTVEGGTLGGKTWTFTLSVDNWPNPFGVSDFYASLTGGTAWNQVKTIMQADSGGTPYVSVVGKTVTLTFPTSVDSVLFGSEEKVSAKFQATQMTRSGYMEADEQFTITATTPPGELSTLPIIRAGHARKYLARAGW